MVIILRFQICLDVDNNRWLLATSRRPCSCSLHFSFHFIDKYYRIAPNRIFPFFHRRVPVIHLPVTRDWCGDGCGREGDAHALVWWLIILLIPTQSVNLNWLAFDYCNTYKAAEMCSWRLCFCWWVLERQLLLQVVHCSIGSCAKHHVWHRQWMMSRDGNEYRGAHCSSTMGLWKTAISNHTTTESAPTEDWTLWASQSIAAVGFDIDFPY